jgi:hypothetical protein
VLAFMLLTWRAAAVSAAWCPVSSFIPSPGNASGAPSSDPPDPGGTIALRWSAPEVQVVVCTSSVGPLEIELRSDWSPLGVARFLELVSVGFFTDIAVFRVVPGFVAQFGISGAKKAFFAHHFKVKTITLPR